MKDLYWGLLLFVLLVVVLVNPFKVKLREYHGGRGCSCGGGGGGGGGDMDIMDTMQIIIMFFQNISLFHWVILNFGR